MPLSTGSCTRTDVRIKSVSPPCHVRPASVLSSSYSYHVRGISLRKFTQGYDKNVTRTQHGRRMDIIRMNADRDGQILMTADSIRMWREFDTEIQHGCDTDAIRTWHEFNPRCICKSFLYDGLVFKKGNPIYIFWESALVVMFWLVIVWGPLMLTFLE